MMHDILPSYFTPDEVFTLRETEGKKLVSTVYTIWKNVAKPEAAFQALDWISLGFGDGVALDIYGGAESEGIQIKPLNFSLLQTQIWQQFRGQVEIEQVEMSQSPIWQPVIGQRIQSIGLASPSDDLFQNHLIQIHATEMAIEISKDEEGLLAYPLPQPK